MVLGSKSSTKKLNATKTNIKISKNSKKIPIKNSNLIKFYVNIENNIFA
jgi:hypothetical protein